MDKIDCREAAPELPAMLRRAIDALDQHGLEGTVASVQGKLLVARLERSK